MNYLDILTTMWAIYCCHAVSSLAPANPSDDSDEPQVVAEHAV